MQLSCFFTGTLAMALTICTGELMAEVLLFRGKKFTATNTFTLPGDRPNCSQEIKIFSNLTGNLPRRLVSCPDSKLWTTDVSTGITNSETKMNYSLEHVSLNCSCQIISGYNHQSEIEWQASLQITALMADPGPPFDEIRFEIICSCMDCSGLKFRQAEVYFVKQAESNKTSPTWKPSTAGTTVTDLSLNSTLPTPTPPSTEHRDADHKNNLGMIIGIPVASVLVLVVVFALVRYRHKINRIIQIKINRCFVRQNNNTTAESIDI